MKKLWILFALLLVAGTCTAQTTWFWYTKPHGDTLGKITVDKKVNAWFSATKGWQYANPKATLSSGSLEERATILSAKVDSLEKREARTRRDLAKALKRIKILEGK